MKLITGLLLLLITSSGLTSQSLDQLLNQVSTVYTNLEESFEDCVAKNVKLQNENRMLKNKVDALLSVIGQTGSGTFFASQIPLHENIKHNPTELHPVPCFAIYFHASDKYAPFGPPIVTGKH